MKTIAELKERLRSAFPSAHTDERGMDLLKCSALKHKTAGIRRGILVELCGRGKTEWVSRFLAEHPELEVAWLEETGASTVFPAALAERRVNLSRVMFVEVERADGAWALLQLVNAGLFDVVVARQTGAPEKFLRRLQLCARKSRTTCLLMNEKRAPQGSCFGLRIQA